MAIFVYAILGLSNFHSVITCIIYSKAKAQEAIKERATDIHLEPQEKQVTVRIRIDGVLQVIMTPPHSSLSGLSTRIKILSKLNIAEKDFLRMGDFLSKRPGKILMFVFQYYRPYMEKRLLCVF